ncbi:hypothetical protein DFJ43DRAFT_1043883 [Lentinula guzmanii]|uniref:Uncharacterized protein n=1 Tax=Lentinula guzmanii TaxID=2804957 RepID=A0AA38J9J4_9AGAR|nr:hypothetical protein DFJ43DRAFT_1043883 [Lentinula guzmanii]
MAPPKKSLGDDIERHPTQDLFQCKVCFAIDPTEAIWMKRSSVREHLKTNKHLQSAQLKAISEKQKADERQKVEHTYIGPIPLTVPSSSFRAKPRATAPNMQPAPNSYIPTEAPYDELFLHPERGPTPDECSVDDLVSAQFSELLEQALHLDEFGIDDSVDLEDEDIGTGIEDAEDEPSDDEEHAVSRESPYYPYPSKVSMLLDILDNLPWLRLSSNSVKLYLWMLKVLHIPGVPSFNSFRTMQDKLRKDCGFTPDAHISDFKNHYHSINPAQTVAHDFANPQVAPHINLYPERTDGPRSEAWQFERINEYSPSQLTPMISRGLRQFWIDEVAQLNDGSYVIPRNWINVTTAGKTVLSSDCSNVQVTLEGWLLSGPIRTVPAECFKFNYDDVISSIGDNIRWHSEGVTAIPEMPNQLRNLADGDDLYVVMVPLWCDDVSGNKSKQYNKHINIYSVNGSLPGQMLQQEYFVNFVSTSPNATSLEQFKTLRDQIKVVLRVPILPADNPQQAEEASHMGGNATHPCRKCTVGGNYQEKETPDVYHSFYCDVWPFGSVGFCVSGWAQLSQYDKLQSFISTSDGFLPSFPGLVNPSSGYFSHYSGHLPAIIPANFWLFPGLTSQCTSRWPFGSVGFCDSAQRSAEKIKEQLNAQLEAAMTGVEANVTRIQTASGTKDKITEQWIQRLISQARQYKAETKLPQSEIMQKLREWLRNEPGEKMNPLLDITGLDPSQDTPVEILHTILLGIVKYVWHMTNTSMTEKELELLAIRLQSADTDGLTVPPVQAAYMVQYRNNLIGKHFKTLMQILAFHIHKFSKLNDAHFRLIRSVGALGALLWVPEIKDLNQYLDDLDVLLGNVLDAFADVDPSKIIKKIKIHLLTHLRRDIRRFGPPIRYSTEIFKAFNAIFRLCSVYSNHQAPSRDIAFQFASMNRVKHILSGGFFQLQESGEWVQAAEAVRRILLEVPIIQRHLGWVPHPKIEFGKVTFSRSKQKAQVLSWAQTKASLSSGSPLNINVNVRWLSSDSPKVIAATGDSCKIGSWVFAKNGELQKQDMWIIGRITEILLQEGSAGSSGLITIEQFDLGTNIHEDFQCPILRRSASSISVSVHSSDVQFRFSAQHDCRLGNCQPTRRVNQIQERVITERVQQLLEHTDDDNFIVNMYALHNAAVLREALPRSLWKPVPLYDNRRLRHDKLVQTFAITSAEKRANTQEKAQATKARNKKAAQGAGTLETSRKRPRTSVLPEVGGDAGDIDRNEGQTEEDIESHQAKRYKS